MIIDAHAHLWLNQDTEVDGQPIYQLPHNRSRSMFFGEERQMLPPWMTDGKNTAERFLSNMDYAQVSAAVVTQEFIDGVQNDYLLQVVKQYPHRFKAFGMPRNLPQSPLPPQTDVPPLADEAAGLLDQGLCGVKLPAARMHGSLTAAELLPLYRLLEERDAVLHVELKDGDAQVGELEEIVQSHPRLRVLVGHFGMVTRPGWLSQIRLARHERVCVESGGITWLFNDEFYPFPSAVRAIREAADLVGWEKLLWGSDYPRTITAITYRMSYDFVSKSAELTERQKQLFLGDNARRFFGFGELEEPPYVKNMSE